MKVINEWKQVEENTITITDTSGKGKGEKEIEEKWKSEINPYASPDYVKGYLQGCKKREEELNILLNFIGEKWPMPLGWGSLVARLRRRLNEK